MNNIDNSIKSYLTLCRQKQLNVVYRIIDDLALDNSIVIVAENHNLSTNTVEHTKRIFQLVGGDSMKIIADKIYAKYAGKTLDPVKKIIEGNQKIIKGEKELNDINTEAQRTVDNLKQLKETTSALGTTLGLDKVGKSIGDFFSKKNQSNTPTIKSLQDENDMLKKQLEECNNKLKSKAA